MLLILLFVWAMRGADIDLEQTAEGLPRLAEFFGRLFPPNFEAATTVFQATLETLQIAMAGTLLSIVASVILGMLAATNLTPEWVHQPLKWALGALRGIPLILLALMFVTVVVTATLLWPGTGDFMRGLTVPDPTTEPMSSRHFVQTVQGDRCGSDV